MIATWALYDLFWTCRYMVLLLDRFTGILSSSLRPHVLIIHFAFGAILPVLMTVQLSKKFLVY
jgi:hypothetical protein